MTSTILISIVTSLLAATIYGFLISNKEESIRNYLKNSAHGLARRVYVHAFISAARGKDKVADTSNLVFLLLFVCFSTALYVHSDITKTVNTHENNVERFNEIKKIKPKLTEKELKVQIADLGKSLKTSAKVIAVLKVLNEIFYFGAFGMFYFGLVVWRPYLIMRKRFSHEMDVYIHRIQGLASKQELSKIAVLESKIVDEHSLRMFIFATKEIAARHGVIELVSTFDLWKQNEK